jgi:hypothetical protein
MLARYMDRPSQLKIDGKPYVSTFIGDGFDWSAVEKQVGKPIYSVPFWLPSSENAGNKGLSGLFSWYVAEVGVGSVTDMSQVRLAGSIKQRSGRRTVDD